MFFQNEYELLLLRDDCTCIASVDTKVSRPIGLMYSSLFPPCVACCCEVWHDTYKTNIYDVTIHSVKVGNKLQYIHVLKQTLTISLPLRSYIDILCLRNMHYYCNCVN